MERKKVLVPIKTRKYVACPECGKGSFLGPYPNPGIIPTLCEKCNTTYDVVFYTRKSWRASFRTIATLQEKNGKRQYVKIRDISRVGVGLEFNKDIEIGAQYMMIFTLKNKDVSVVVQITRVTDGQCGAKFCFEHDCCAEQKAIISYMMERETCQP